MTQEQWNQYSFNFQMANIGTEIERTISIWKKKLQSKEDVWPYDFPYVKRAQELIRLSKNDPKNLGLTREIEQAEEELNYFLSIGEYFEPEEWNEEAERLLDYWNNYEQAYAAEADISSTRYYFLVRGHRDWNHDDDQWIGIYNNKKRAQKAYEVSLAAMKQECEMNPGHYAGEEIIIYLFDEERDLFFANVSPEDWKTEEEE